MSSKMRKFQGNRVRNDIVASVEQSISGLPAAAQDEIRVEVSHMLKNSKPPRTSNITREERQALRDLRQNESILILPADKGNSVIVMNKSDYQQEISSMLQDRKTYEPITDKRRNPTAKTAKELQKKLQDLKQSGNLSEQQYKRLQVPDPNPASFYGLPKVYKVELRPRDDHT
ncbi:hypothetical protein ACROYT_G005850 [Oculina patagonica]